MKVSGRSDRVIKPGESDEIEIGVSTNRRSGTLTRKVTVTTNDPNHPKVTLVCKGKVLVPFNVKPKTVRFPKINRDSLEQTKKATITRGDGGPIKLELIPVTGGNVTASLREIEPGEVYELDVTIKPPWPAKKMRHPLKIKTGIPQAPQASVVVYADVRGPVEAVPERLSFRYSDEETTEKPVRLVWEDGLPHKILSASIADPQFVVRIEQDDQGRHSVVVGLPKGAMPAKRSLSLEIKTDDQKNPTVRVPVTAIKLPKKNKQPKSASGSKTRPGAAIPTVQSATRTEPTGRASNK